MKYCLFGHKGINSLKMLIGREFAEYKLKLNITKIFRYDVFKIMGLISSKFKLTH